MGRSSASTPLASRSGVTASAPLASASTLMARDKGGPKIAFQPLVCPVMDYAFDTASYLECANGYRPKRDLMRWFWHHYLEERDEDGESPDLIPTPCSGPLGVTARTRDHGRVRPAARRGRGVRRPARRRRRRPPRSLGTTGRSISSFSWPTASRKAGRRRRRRAVPSRPAAVQNSGRLSSRSVSRTCSARSRSSGEGRVDHLDCGRFPGMPVYEGHAPFMVLNYRTGRGLEAQGDHRWLDAHGEGNNTVCFGWQSEVLIHSTHSGTHIDSLAHVTRGRDHHWFGGANEERDLGDFGPMRWDASAIPPIVTRGVLIDLAAARGMTALPAHSEVGPDEVERLQARQRQDRARRRRPPAHGLPRHWPRPEKERHFQAGINVEAAELLADAGAVAIGSDTEGLENQPSRVEGNAFPVHLELLVERGVHILEMVFCEELARDGVYEFAFVCLPLKISGATGSLVRPVAMV